MRTHVRTFAAMASWASEAAGCSPKGTLGHDASGEGGSSATGHGTQDVRHRTRAGLLWRSSRHVTPGVTLAIDYALNHVEDALERPQRFALDDQLTIALTGTTPVVTGLSGRTGLFALVHRTRGAELRTDAGTLTLKSSEFPADDVSVGAGECLFFDAHRAGTHEVLRTYYADTCP